MTRLHCFSHDQVQQHEINMPVTSLHNSSQPPLNQPREDLITGSREEYLKVGIPLYQASINGDWPAARAILNKNPELLRSSITRNGDTTLHVAASTKSTDRMNMFVESLVDLMDANDLTLQNKSSNTAFCLAVAAGNVKIVGTMMIKNRTLLEIPGNQGMLPIYIAALFGKSDVVRYLYKSSEGLHRDCWMPQNRNSLLLQCVEADIFDVALQIWKDHPELASNGSTILGILARKPHAFSERKSIYTLFLRILDPVVAPIGLSVAKAPENKSEASQLLRTIWNDIVKKPTDEIDDILRGPPDSQKEEDLALQLQKLINENIVKVHVETKNIMTRTCNSIMHDQEIACGNDDQVAQLKKVISQHIVKLDAESQRIISGPIATISNAKKTYSTHMLFVAAEIGNAEFVHELIREYPDLALKVNDSNQTIFHIAIKNRHKGIYNLLSEIGPMKDLITPLRDENDNNMLHLVAKCPKKGQLEDVYGAALQMQQELLWFQEVKNMIPPPYWKQKNKDSLTPGDLFSEEHKDLVIQGEKWLKATANQFMVVGALIATILFAAAITIPGGYNQDDGIPIFSKRVAFIIFVMADSVSFVTSVVCILAALSIITSSYGAHDFLFELPFKLNICVLNLFVSLITMMITFSLIFFLQYQRDVKWIPLVITFLAAFPLIILNDLLHPLMDNAVIFFRNLFSTKNMFLSTKNPITTN